MSARNMVRNLRDSGVLASKPPAPEWRASLVMFCFALSFGAVAYLGAVYGLPALGSVVSRPPPPMSFAKPAYNQVRFFSPTDAAACSRFADMTKERESKIQALAQSKNGNPYSTPGGGVGSLGPQAARLACQAQTRPMRFCNPDERAAFVQTTMAFAAEYTRIVEGTRKGAAAADREPDSSFTPNGGRELFQSVMKSVILRADEVDAKVAAVVRDLARKGLITEADFSTGFLVGTPAPIRAMFADVGPVTSVCG